jgi:hypothetical protein
VTSLGLLASLAIDLPNWNWYKFPADFFTVSLLDQVMAFLTAGLAMAAILKPPQD